MGKLKNAILFLNFINYTKSIPKVQTGSLFQSLLFVKNRGLNLKKKMTVTDKKFKSVIAWFEKVANLLRERPPLAPPRQLD